MLSAPLPGQKLQWQERGVQVSEGWGFGGSKLCLRHGQGSLRGEGDRDKEDREFTEIWIHSYIHTCIQTEIDR